MSLTYSGCLRDHFAPARCCHQVSPMEPSSRMTCHAVVIKGLYTRLWLTQGGGKPPRATMFCRWLRSLVLSFAGSYSLRAPRAYLITPVHSNAVTLSYSFFDLAISSSMGLSLLPAPRRE